MVKPVQMSRTERRRQLHDDAASPVRYKRAIGTEQRARGQRQMHAFSAQVAMHCYAGWWTAR